MIIYEQEHKIFRDAVRRFVQQEIVPYVDEWQKKEEIPRSLWKKLGREGYLCPWVEEKYGGSGAGFEYSVIVIEEIARSTVGLVIAEHADMTTPYIADFGTEEQKERWLPGCTSGDIITSIAMTEPNAGSDLRAIRTRAVRDGDYYVINGQKTFITNGIAADLVVLACKIGEPGSGDDGKISLIVVEDGTPGFIKGRKLDKMGLHCENTGELFFEDCRVPRSNLLGEEGMGLRMMMAELQRERLVVTIWAQVLAEKILADAIEYSKTREAFGQPICSFQHNSFKIVEMATEIELGRAFLDTLIQEFLQGKDIITRVSMAKWWISEMANRVAYNSLQLYGGYGYMEEYPIARLYRDVRAQTIYAGTTEIMKLIIARRLGLEKPKR